MDYQKTAKAIIENVGGADNVQDISNCMTRLRFVLKDESQAKDQSIKDIPEVLQVIKQGGQYQVVIGNEVTSVMKEIAKLVNLDSPTKSTEKPINEKQANPISRFFGFISGCITPIIPVLMGCGMISVLSTILTTIGVLSTTSMTYQILSIMGNAGFFFLPMILAYTCAKTMGVSPVLAMAVGGVLLHPNLTALFAEGAPVTFLAIPVTPATYSSSVLPILIIVFLMKYIEKFADWVSPNVIKVFLKPTLVLLVSCPLALIAVGPLGAIMGNWLGMGINFLYSHVGWLTIMLLAALFPFIVMTGMHTTFSPIAMNNLATLGYDTVIYPVALCSNMAQAAAALAVAVKTKNKTMRQTGVAASITAFIAGVTEPALYGINLKLKRPVIAACIGSGLAGLYCGLTNVRVFTLGGSSNIFTLVTMIDPTTTGMAAFSIVINGAIAMAISAVATFILTLILTKTDIPEMQPENVAPSQKIEQAIFSVIQGGQKQLVSPLSGRTVELSSVSDQTFASGVVGTGIGIDPDVGMLYAPTDGVVSSFMDTGHALSIDTDFGANILLHVGIDTVRLQGKHFTPQVQSGASVKQGDLLLTFDMDAIRKEGYDCTTMITIFNTEDFEQVNPTQNETVTPGDTLLSIQLKTAAMAH